MTDSIGKHIVFGIVSGAAIVLFALGLSWAVDNKEIAESSGPIVTEQHGNIYVFTDTRYNIKCYRQRGYEGLACVRLNK